MREALNDASHAKGLGCWAQSKHLLLQTEKPALGGLSGAFTVTQLVSSEAGAFATATWSTDEI